MACLKRPHSWIHFIQSLFFYGWDRLFCASGFNLDIMLFIVLVCSQSSITLVLKWVIREYPSELSRKRRPRFRSPCFRVSKYIPGIRVLAHPRHTCMWATNTNRKLAIVAKPLVRRLRGTRACERSIPIGNFPPLLSHWWDSWLREASAASHCRYLISHHKTK